MLPYFEVGVGAPLPRRLTAFPKTDYNDDAQRPNGGRIFPLLTCN